MSFSIGTFSQFAFDQLPMPSGLTVFGQVQAYFYRVTKVVGY
jgi:hypothetical protein